MGIDGDIYTLHADGTNRLQRTNYKFNVDPIMSLGLHLLSEQQQ